MMNLNKSIGVVFLISWAAVVGGCEKREYQTIRATGQLASLSESQSGFAGPVVWIRHDGYEFKGDDGKVAAVDGMRAPFHLTEPKLLEGLKVGDLIEFEFRSYKKGAMDHVLASVRRRSEPAAAAKAN